MGQYLAGQKPSITKQTINENLAKFRIKEEYKVLATYYRQYASVDAWFTTYYHMVALGGQEDGRRWRVTSMKQIRPNPLLGLYVCSADGYILDTNKEAENYQMSVIKDRLSEKISNEEFAERIHSELTKQMVEAALNGELGLMKDLGDNVQIKYKYVNDGGDKIKVEAWTGPNWTSAMPLSTECGRIKYEPPLHSIPEPPPKCLIGILESVQFEAEFV